MTIQTWLQSATRQLASSGITTARLDALVLLEDCLLTNRATLLAYPDRELTSEQLAVLTEHIQRRSSHEPLAYIRGKSEFYGRNFAITRHVLVPRPESETMITLLKKMCATGQNAALAVSSPLIVDVGTGSGALAITAKLEQPSSMVIATDIDPACIQLAARNADSLQADVTLLSGNLLAPLQDMPDLDIKPVILLCNLPYVPDSYPINQAATMEPRLAIFGGSDGLDVYRRLFEQLHSLPWRPRYMLAESLPVQHDELAALAAQNGYDCLQTDDFIQVFAPTTDDGRPDALAR